MTQNETENSSKPVLAWHFIKKTEQYPNGAIRGGDPAPEDGAWLVHEGPVKCCSSGLHASERLLDALNYAWRLGLDILCKVECDQIEDREEDKFACRKRRILWRIDPEPAIRAFARRCALDVAHLWDCPEVVLRYLKEGREEDREEAGRAAWAAYTSTSWTAIGAAYRVANNAAYRVATWAAYRVAFEAAHMAAEALDQGGADKKAVKEAQNALLEAMVEELRQNPTKTWTF